MEAVVGGRKDLALVDVVDLNRLKHLRLHEMPDAALRHHGNRNRLLDALDHLGIAHAGDTACRTDVGGDALQSHHGARARRLGDPGLLRRRHIHDYAALQHLRQVAVQLYTVFAHRHSPVGFERRI